MNRGNEILDAYGAAFQAAAAGLPGNNTGWAPALRNRAMRDFRKSGFPSRRDEAWRYTDLSPLQKRHYSPPQASAPVSREDLPSRQGMEGARAVMIDGKFDRDLSDLGALDDAVTFMSLSEALEQKPALVEKYLSANAEPDGEDGVRRLNTALMADGCVIIAAAGARQDLPLEILYLNSGGEGAAAHIRNLIVVEEGSAFALVETWRGQGDFWSNIVSEIFVGCGATMNHYQNQQARESDSEALLSATATIHIAEAGQYCNFVLTSGGRVARNEIRALLQGPGAEANLDGLCLARAGQSLAQVTIVEHQAASANSRQRYRSILGARASAAFQGKVVVARDAQHSEAHQTSDSLLLGEGATANAKPELLIHADDVICSHGATVGALDEAALFYLNSRGLEPLKAREILVTAFAEVVLDDIALDSLAEIIRSQVAGWMGANNEAEST